MSGLIIIKNQAPIKTRLVNRHEEIAEINNLNEKNILRFEEIKSKTKPVTQGCF